jgi:hypothetical protein
MPDIIVFAVTVGVTSPAQVVSVELVTKGRTTASEGHLENAGKRIELTMAADGTAAKP